MIQRIEAQMQGGFLFCQAIKNIISIDKAIVERKKFCQFIPSHRKR
jgi:hypothetical protein